VVHEPLALGVDFGTSAVKAVAMTEHGQVEAEASADYPTDRPGPNRAEQAPDDWWRALVTVCRSILSAVDGRRLVGIGLSGQLNGIVLVDAQGRVLRQALIWLDQNCDAETELLAQTFGDGLGRIAGSDASPIAVLPKLRRLCRDEPEVMRRVAHVLQVKDYILWRLTGVIATEANEASATLMMELSSRSWHAGLVGFSGMEPAVFPPIRPSAAFAGAVTAEAAAATSLPEGLGVAPGSGDTGALALGCGAYEHGIAAVTLGTAGHVVAAVPNRPTCAVPGLWRMAHVTDDRELWLGLMPSGGLCLAWMRDLFGGIIGARPTFDEIERIADAAPPGSANLVFLPFLEGAGTPWNRPDLRASFQGLDTRHAAGHMVRAVYEGVAFNLRAALAHFEASSVPIRRVHLAEGGARSQLWCQIIADALDRDVHLVAQGDTSAVGAAILGFAAASGRPLQELVQSAVRLDRTFRPNPAVRHEMDRAAERFSAAVGRACGNG
jgi:xylulokinase